MIQSTGVHALVGGHAALPLEFLSAVGAHVGLLTGVETHVSLQVGLARKCLLTALHLANVHFNGRAGYLRRAWRCWRWHVERSDEAGVGVGVRSGGTMKLWRAAEELLLRTCCKLQRGARG